VSLRKSRASTLGRARRPSKLLKHSMPFAMLSTPNARARRVLRAQSRARHDLAARQGGIGRSAPRGSGRGVLGCDEDGVKLAHAMRHLSEWGQIGDAREKATQRQPVLCRELTLLPQYRLPARRYLVNVVYFARGSSVHGPFMPVCSTGGASAGDPRRSRPAQRAVRGGGRASQSSKSCITRSRDDAARSSKAGRSRARAAARPAREP
jgi:hypothetical protein